MAAGSWNEISWLFLSDRLSKTNKTMAALQSEFESEVEMHSGTLIDVEVTPLAAFIRSRDAVVQNIYM